MARSKKNETNIDNSDPANYPDGRIKNNTGGGDGTPVNEATKGDIHEFFDKAMRLYGITHNGLPDNTANGYQLIEAMKALASKNDFIFPLSESGGELTVPVKLGKLLDDESIVLKASADKGAETHIKGTLDGTSKVITYLGSFKANEYVRMINTPGAVVLVRMIDSFNLDSAVGDLSFLKAANQTEENAGTIATKSTTPLTHKTSFIKRVNGTDSPTYLAIPTGTGEKNGLLSHEDKKKIDDLGALDDAIKIESASYVTVNNFQTGAKQDDFNSNYIDVFPPTGKDMTNLKGVMASHAYIQFDGNVDDNDIMWCRWQIQATKVRIICGAIELEAAAKVNWITIWI